MDVIVVGTGVSALLLAQQLVHSAVCERITLLGPKRPVRPHLLSYWSDRPTPFDRFAVASWSNIGVSFRDHQHRLPLSRFAYRSIRGQHWADAVRAELEANARVRFIDEKAEVVEDDLLRPAVRWRGKSLRADWVFDSHQLDHTPSCWQRFEGWEVVSPDLQLDTSMATLLDFRTAASGDFRFVYALPLARDRLFVEHVTSKTCDHELALRAYLHDVLGLCSYEVVDREGGATPLFRQRPHRGDGRIIGIGVTAGLAKTTTGYALTRLWHDAEHIASKLSKGLHPTAQLALPSLFQVADRFFVDTLKSQPERLEALLSELFSEAPTDAVLAFLDESATAREQLLVASAMPNWLRWAADERA